MKADNTKMICGGQLVWGLLLLVSVFSGAMAEAQTVTFEQLVLARQTTALLEHNGLVIGGIQGGGLVLWRASDPTIYERLTAGAELSGNDVTDLAWTGQHVWVATRGGGLTRITDVAGQRSFRQYVSNLGSLNVTSVTGVIVGENERVYYGMDGGGVGQINNGLSGAVFTAEQDGLINDAVNSLQIYDGDLFVATAVGVSRFADNLFSDQNVGLTSLEVHDLALDTDGELLAGTAEGVFRWDPVGETWALVGTNTDAALEVSCAAGRIYARSTNVRVFNGSSWQTLQRQEGIVGAIYAGNDFWIGGQAGINLATEFVVRNAYVGRLSGATSFTVFEVPASQNLGAAGVAFSGDTPYIGSQIWQSVVSFRQNGTWDHITYQPASAENVGTRLSEGLVLSMASGPDDEVWTGLYNGTGLARTDPVTGLTDLINPTNSGLQGRNVVNIVVHPDGPVITLHDWVDAEKVEILVDPADWADAASWMVLPRDGGLGTGPSIWDAVVERADVIWFAVESVGVVRWDINGDQAGPDDPLTWLDQSDDRWDAPLLNVTGSSLNLGTAEALELGADGSIWVGGNGLMQFRYDELTSTAEHLTSLSEKFSPLREGLVNGSVTDIVRDANGDIWVATLSGVNRVRGSGAEVVVDAYIDLGNYFANPSYPVLYSPNAISPLPGNSYRKIAASRDRQHILVSADQGASLITVVKDVEAVDENQVSAYLFPNPFHSDVDAGLSLGGLDLGTTASVEIYNLDGQLVFANDAVTPETGFWGGINRVGQKVTTGLYVVRVTSDGVSQALTLAVVR